MSPRKRTSTRATRIKRPRRAPDPLTRAQDARYSAMRRAGIDQKTIADALAARGNSISRQAVGGVIRNRFINEDVIAMFCELTETTRARMWPDVPLPDETARAASGD